MRIIVKMRLKLNHLRSGALRYLWRGAGRVPAGRTRRRPRPGNKEPDNDEEENSQILPPEQFGVKYNNEKFVQLKFCKGYQDQNYEIEITNEETQVKQYFGPYPGKGEDKMTLVTVHGLQPGLIVRGRVYVEGNPSLSSNSVDFNVRCASLLR